MRIIPVPSSSSIPPCSDPGEQLGPSAWIVTTVGSTRASTDFRFAMCLNTLVLGENRTMVVSRDRIAPATARPTPSALAPPTKTATSTTAIQPRNELADGFAVAGWAPDGAAPPASGTGEKGPFSGL